MTSLIFYKIGKIVIKIPCITRAIRFTAYLDVLHVFKTSISLPLHVRLALQLDKVVFNLHYFIIMIPNKSVLISPNMFKCVMILVIS